MVILEEMTSQAMQRRLSALIAVRPDVETLGYILGRERLLEWAHAVGISMDHELRDFAPPVPPLNLRSIVAAPTEAVFLWSGLKDAEMCGAYLDRPLRTDDAWCQNESPGFRMRMWQSNPLFASGTTFRGVRLRREQRPRQVVSR